MTEQLKSPGSGAPSGRGLNWSESFRRLWNRCLKPVLPAAAIALASQVQGLASNLRFKIEQTGADVVMTVSGSINTSSLVNSGWIKSQSGSGGTSVIYPTLVGFNGLALEVYRGVWQWV